VADLAPRRDAQTWEQLLEVLRRQLPVEEWTDHNPSDPGIMLLELLCWLGEMASYRMDRIPESHERAFLNFLLPSPQPVTVDVTFRVVFQAAPGTATVTIPAGTLVATEFSAGRRPARGLLDLQAGGIDPAHPSRGPGRGGHRPGAGHSAGHE
jgi:hypothetical protein